MSNRTPSPPTRITWFSGRAFLLVGILLALGALALPVWRLAHPSETAPTDEAPAEPPMPVLLPETPLREESEEAEAQPVDEDAAPQPALESVAPDTHPPDRLVIPAIDLDAPVMPVGWTAIDVGGETVGQWQVPDTAAVGWHDTSAGVGQADNLVLNGHHNRYGEVFRRLEELEVGDDLSLWSGNDEVFYEITETVILPEMGQPMEVRLANAERILPSHDERVTLVTCWPYTGNSHRLIVVAQPVRLAADNWFLSLITD